MKYRKHVFVCCNQKAEGKKSCGAEHGMQMVQQLREKLSEEGINPKADIRVQQSGCLGICKKGPAIAVYPEGVFYKEVQHDRLDDIVQQHLLNDNIVKDLQLDD